MPVDRFFLDSSFSENKDYRLDATESHHLLKVTRHQLGDEIELINGKGDLAKAKISTIDRKEAIVTIDSTKQLLLPSPTFELAIGLMRSSKLEWIVEKATELGAIAFLFFKADLSEKENFSESNLKRLQSITIASIKQSGRLYLPTISYFPNLKTVLEKKEGAFCLYGDVSGNEQLIDQEKKILFITGPESGFSEKEKNLLSKKAKPFSLSNYTLRAETAPIAFSSLVSFQSKK